MKKESSQKQNGQWVNVYDDDSIRNAGVLRPYKQSNRDKDVWTKTPSEKRFLKSIKRFNEDGHFHNKPIKYAPLFSKLIIYLKKNKHFPKSTYSTKCWLNDIPYIIGKYNLKDNKPIVLKYSFNGKTYSPSEIPFWG